MRCTMRCHDVSSSRLRSRSSIEVLIEWFSFFHTASNAQKKNAFPHLLVYHTSIYHPRDIFYLDAYTIFIYCVFCTYYYYYTSLWTSLRFLPGICEFLIRLTCFLIAFPCISHAFTRTVAIAIDSRKIESNSGRGEIFETRVIIVIYRGRRVRKIERNGHGSCKRSEAFICLALASGRHGE